MAIQGAATQQTVWLTVEQPRQKSSSPKENRKNKAPVCYQVRTDKHTHPTVAIQSQYSASGAWYMKPLCLGGSTTSHSKRSELGISEQCRGNSAAVFHQQTWHVGVAGVRDLTQKQTQIAILELHLHCKSCIHCT